MQLHQLVDKCIEWVALDGVLGTEPLALHQHLRKSDPSLDDAYFAYLYTVLIEHPSIRVSLTQDPLAAPDKTVRLGDAPLPDDFSMPDAVRRDVNISAMYLNGVRGRALAYHLSGEDFKSNAQAVEDRREGLKKNALEKSTVAARKEIERKKKLPQPSLEEGLIRNLEADDGAGIAKEDLNGLAQRWGSRLRLRCTDEEIYYRLTGTHLKNPKITPIVFQTLQLAAKSREHGITAVELGPLVGASQGSMHHYMKVLTTLGLCAKIPTVFHAATTNILLFHTFLKSNDNYKATKEGVLAIEAETQLNAPLEAEDVDDPTIAAGPATASDWGLTFSELSEEQLMNGYILKERLSKLLDHPSLTNHLLRAKNLLPLLGWKAESGLRHRRAVPRAIRAMIESGQVQYVDVGPKGIRCIRLTKYDPDRIARVKPETVKPITNGLHDIGQLVTRYSPPLVIPGGVTSLQSIPYQIGELVRLSGSEGMRIIDLRDSLFGLFRRMIEFHFARMEKMTTPPTHLHHRRVTTVMESWGRERRLRAFSMTVYRKILIENRQPLNDKIHPPTPPEAGHFADVSYRRYCVDPKVYDKFLDKIGTPSQGTAIVEKAKVKVQPKRARSHTPAENGPPVPASPEEHVPAQPDLTSHLNSHMKKPKAKTASYGQESQVRGRPRKYIHVVTPDGTVERLIIGSVLPHPDLAPVWIYLPLLDKLVPASSGYSGLGPAPDPTDDELNLAQSPEWFNKYPRQKGSKAPAPGRRKLLGKEARSANPAKRKSPPPAAVIDMTEDKEDGSSKRRSKRPRVDRPAEQDIDHLIAEHEGLSAPIAASEQAEEDIVLIDGPSLAPPSFVGEPDHAPRRIDSTPSDVGRQTTANAAPTPIVTTVAGNFDELDGIDPALDGYVPSPGPPIVEEPILEVNLEQRVDHARPKSPSPPHAVIDPTVAGKASRAGPSPQSYDPGPSPQAPPGPSFLHVSPVQDTRAESHTPPLRERSLSPTRHQQMPPPYTPSHQYPPPPPHHFFTPPGVQSYTVLPPVVYIPPGYTVWPPLPPGYPTTNIPPPNHQPSPVPSAMPGFWNHTAQRQPPEGPYNGHPHVSTQSHPSPFARLSPSRHRPRDTRQAVTPSASSPAPSPSTVGSRSAFFQPRESSGLRDQSTRSHPPIAESRPVAQVRSREATQPPRPSPSPIGPSSSSSSSSLRAGSHRPASAAPSPRPMSPDLPDQPTVTDVEMSTQVSEVASSSPPPEQTVTIDSSPVTQPVSVPAGSIPSQPDAPIQKDQTPVVENPAPAKPSTPAAELTPIRAPKVRAKKGRMDLGAIRRANEMLFVLQEVGGVYEEHELWKLHQEWSFRVAGTDVPYAPSRGATMDRTVWKKLIQTTKDDGRTDNTQSSVPTSTAAWRNYRIIWLVDTPKDRVQEYMRSLAHTIKRLTAPKEFISTKLPHMQYTEVKLPPQHPSSTNKTQLVEEVDKESRQLTGDERRNALCKDPMVLSQLYGRQSGKWARTSLFHRALRDAVEAPDCISVLDRSAGVFLAPMMSQDIAVGAFYGVVLTHERDDELLKWLKSPGNKQVPVRDVPFDIRGTHDQRRQRTQTRIRQHVDTLLALGLLSPLAVSPIEEAYIVVNVPSMPNTPLKIDTKETLVDGRTTTYVLHAWAPIYHIAAEVPVLLGYMPVRNELEINAYWDAYRFVCLERGADRLPEFTPKSSIDSRNIANVPNVLRISTGWSKSMCQLHRWNNELRLLPIQRDALNDAIIWAEAKSTIETPEQIHDLAWEFALPEDAVQQHLERRLRKAKEAKEMREKREVEMHEARQLRQQRAQRALAVKLSIRQAQSKRAWEERVAAICARLHVHFDNRLLDHVSRQSLTSLTKGSLTDEMVERMIRQHYSQRLLQSVKENLPPPSMPPQPLPVIQNRAPRKLAKRDRPFKTPGKRYRRKWSAEDDELIVDGDAVIRARNRDRPPHLRNRIGLERLFPGSSVVTMVSRLKKSIDKPEKETYVTLLADAWYKIWVQYRGTDELPDTYFEDNHDLDIRAHIAFMRKHVNKTELSVEAKAIASSIVPVKKEIPPELPDRLSKVLGEFSWQYLPTTRASFDMLWQLHNSQEVRMGQIGSLSLLQRDKTAGPLPEPNLAKHRLRAIIRMIIATEASQYAQPASIALLKDYDQTKTVNPEINRMQHEKILVRHGSASSTGRFYSFAAAWEGLRHGPFTSDFYEDAAGLEDKISKPAGMDWPVVGSSGELASLMNMVSDQTVEFEINPQEFPSVMAGGAIINTRRLYDHAFEFGMKAKKVGDVKIIAEPPSIYHCPTPRGWNGDYDSTPTDLSRLNVEVDKAGPGGISKAELVVALGINRDELDQMLAGLSTTNHPRVFWAGYDTARLVSQSFWPEWQCPARRFKLDEDGKVDPEGDGEVRCTPRIWVDIWGRRMEDKWDEAVGCAKGWLISRPGLTERIFRQKVGMVMDRLETNDVLQYLIDKGSAKRVWTDGRTSPVPPVEAVDVDEEEDIVWRPESKRLLA